MTKHLVGGIILLDCTVIWLQMVDNTGVVLVARQLKEPLPMLPLALSH